MNTNKALSIAIWILSGLTAALFLLSAVPKFFMEGWIGRFAGWGYPEWFLYAIATLEIAGAVGLLIPRVAALAAVGLIVIMLGAMYTHLSHDQGIAWNLAYVISLSLILSYRWRNRRANQTQA